VESNALHFTTAAKVLGSACRRVGLKAPGYRSPPRHAGVDRTIRRSVTPGTSEAAVIAVRVRGRPWAAVVADMVDGAVVANDLDPVAADALRRTLWDAVAAANLVAAEPTTDSAPATNDHAGRVARRGSLHLARSPAA